MKKKILALLVLFLCVCIKDAHAQSVADQKVEDEIISLDTEIKVKQKRLLELKLQKLKQQQEEIQNELKSLDNPAASQTKTEVVLPPATKTPADLKKTIPAPEIPKEVIKSAAFLKTEPVSPVSNPNPTVGDRSTDPKCNSITARNTYDRKLCVLTNQFYTDAAAPAGIPDLMNNPDELAVLFVHLAQGDENIKNFILKFENKRTDKQVGAGSTNSGTTSLAVKGTAPRIIGWAIENGAATSDVSGTTVTIRTNPFGLLKLATGNADRLPFLERVRTVNSETNFSMTQDNSFANFAKKLSVGVSFDTTRGTDPPTFIGSKQQISAVSFRYEFINHRDPLREEFNDEWNEFFQSQLETLETQFDSSNALIEVLPGAVTRFKNPVLRAWVEETQRQLLAIPLGADGKRDFTALRVKIEERLQVLPIAEVLKDAAVKGALTSLAESGAKFSEASKDFLKKLNKAAIVTFEYTNNREVDKPDTSNFNFIAEFGKKLGEDQVVDITFNGSLTMYNKKPTVADVKRIKDFNFALQADMPFFPDYFGDTFLSFSGKYVRQQGDVVLPNGLTVPGSKGDIAIGQAKVTIPIPNWGIRFPISVTFANRTELIKESTVRGNFGVTLDLDSLFGRKRLF